MPPKAGTGARRGVRAEKGVAKRLNGRHVGGPGRPDIVVRRRKVENKHWSGAVHSGVVRTASRRGVKQVNASGRGGFTAPARVTAKRLGVRLTRRRP